MLMTVQQFDHSCFFVGFSWCMTRLRVKKRLDFDPEIECTIKNLRRSKQEQEVKQEEADIDNINNEVEMANE